MKACMTFTCETCKIWLMIKVLENDVYQVGQICSDLLHRTCYTAFRKPFTQGVIRLSLDGFLFKLQFVVQPIPCFFLCGFQLSSTQGAHSLVAC